MIIIRRVLAHVFTIVGKFDSLYCAESARAMDNVFFLFLSTGLPGLKVIFVKKFGLIRDPRRVTAKIPLHLKQRLFRL